MRRAKKERVTDLVNFDRVRGFLRTIYWRKKFLAYRDDRKRTLNAEADGKFCQICVKHLLGAHVTGIPAIVLQPTPATPPMDDEDPFNDDSRDLAPSPSPPPSPARSPDLYASPQHAGRMSPSLSVSTQPRHRKLSGSSMLSSDHAHNRNSPSLENAEDGQDIFDSMATSMWGGKFRPPGSGTPRADG